MPKSEEVNRAFCNPFIVFHTMNIASVNVTRYLTFTVFFSVMHPREIGKFLKIVKSSSSITATYTLKRIL